MGLSYGPSLPISQEIHSSKYRLTGESFIDGVHRFTSTLSDNDKHRHNLNDLLYDMRFLPAGRVQAAIGSPRKLTLWNCFVSGIIADDFNDIMDKAKEAGHTMRLGGGIGYDFSTLRPRGSLIKSLGSQSSGPVSFMAIYDTICGTIASAGHRRGAQMGVLRCLAGDTPIHTIVGLKSIASLVGQRPYVYACDYERKRVRIIQADEIIVTDTNRKMVRVTFDDMRSVDCTLDHQFLLRSGKYREAQDLKRGDRLMAIAQQIDRHGNAKRFIRQVGCTDGRLEYEHRIVARDILGEVVNSDWNVHHKNEDPCDNYPENLKMVSRSDHASEHVSNLLDNQKRIAAARKGKTRAELYGKEKAAEWESRRQQSRLEKTGAMFGKLGNHRVVSVEPIEDADFVYDIVLPKWHNFAANGVFVHNCDHPDIEEFIHAKRNSHNLTRFNISVGITDQFMRAVQKDGDFALKWRGKTYSKISATALWETIMRSTWDWAEPGVMFLDRINEWNNLRYCENITTSNPCCLSGDTLIAVAGRGPVSIKQLAEEKKGIPVFAKNKLSGVTHVSWGHTPRWVRKANMVKVTFDDGSFVRCSDDHHFPLRNGKRVMARDLKADDSLFRHDQIQHWKSHELIIDGQTEHHMIAEAKYDKEFEWGFKADQFQVHHVNKNHFDNSWDNIEVLTALEHQNEHHLGAKRSDETKRRIGTETSLRFQDSVYQKKFQESMAVAMSKEEVRQKLRVTALARSSEIKKTCPGCGNEFTVRVRTETSLKARKQFCSRSCNATFQNKQQKKVSYNHKVVSVEADGYEDVYNITVEKYHNYAIVTKIKTNGQMSGVFAENSEQPLPPYGACLLGSFNLVKYLTEDRKFDYRQLHKDVQDVVRAMDNCIDIGVYPLPQQEEEGKSKRRMGLGVTGVANALEYMGFSYASEPFISELSKILENLRDSCYKASARLADEKGSFPLYDEEKYLEGKFIKTLPAHVREDIKKSGIRNSHLLSIAPTGTISLAADNVSSGIEPVFTYEYQRKIQRFEDAIWETVQDYGFRVWNIRGRTADQVSVADHVRVLTTAQQFVDSAVSKTCNVGADVSWEDFKGAYLMAYEGGAKGVTTFRASGKREGIFKEVAPTIREEYVSDEDTVEACYFDPVTGRRSCE